MPCSRSAAQAVEQQREVEVAALRADLLGVGLEGGELIVEEHLRFVQQAADQRALAVVDAAAGDEAQQGLALVRCEVPLDVRGRRGRRVRDIRSSLPASSSPSTPSSRGRSRGPGARRSVASSISSMIAVSVVGVALDGAGQRIAAERAEAHALHRRLSRRVAAACGRRRP